MNDPFIFNPALVHEGPAHLSYPLPTGERIGVLHYGTRMFHEGRLKELFEKTVAGLSAHQRMEWMAALREEVAP